VREWYEFFTEDETETSAANTPGQKCNAQEAQKQELQNAALIAQRAHMINSLLTRLYDRFPLLATQFRTDIECLETLDLVRRLSITLALARNEATARRAILAVTQVCPNMDEQEFS
jgi:hypothetical protein